MGNTRDEKIKAEYAEKRVKWLTDNGFNSAEKTYVYFPVDSFDVKEELKDAGFRFNPSLFWHIAEVPAEYAEKVIEIGLNEVAEISAWGMGAYSPDAKAYVSKRMKEARPVVESGEWIGQEKERLRNIVVTLKSIRGMETRFGWTQLVKFEDENHNELNWWTAVDINAEVGEKISLTGTVKKLDEYNGKKITVMTRCKIEEI